MEALREPEAAVGSVRDRVDELMRVADAEAAEQDPARVGPSVAVGVL